MKEKVESFLVTCREVLSLPRDLISPKRSSKYLSSLFFSEFWRRAYFITKFSKRATIIFRQ